MLNSCTKELKFEQKKFEQKIRSKNDIITKICIDVPIAKGISLDTDSINKAVFTAIKEIVYVGDKPFQATNYPALTAAFINYYTNASIHNTTELAWTISIQGEITHKSETILNIALNHYSFTGGAHGYAGKRSLIFDSTTGKLISNKKLFLDEQKFKIMAESKFRIKYKIPPKGAINATDFMFENDEFQLPQTYFFTKKGLLLFYNVYEIASYSQGNFEVLIQYNEIKPYLKTI